MKAIPAFLYNANGNLLWLIEQPAFTSHFLDDYAKIAQNLCSEADGLLLFNSTTHESWILNKDGSKATFCGNGLLIIAFHLQEQKGLHRADLVMSGESVHAEMKGASITIHLDKQVSQIIEKAGAYFVEKPNPHLVFIEPPRTWVLEAEGHAQCVVHDANIEWVWEGIDGFEVKVYERGVGPTAACGSGALAIFRVLQYLGKVIDQARIKMSGDVLTVTDLNAKLALQGRVSRLTTQEIKDDASIA